jgi:hypothetical protein
MKKLQRCCTVIVLFVSSAFSYGLSFYIFDAKTNQEIPEVTIRIVGNGLNLSIAYSAGSSDSYNFSGGTYTFTFSASGYKDSSVTTTLSGFKSFSIGLKAPSSLRFNAGPHPQTPFDVHYDKQSSVLHITGSNSGFEKTAIRLFSFNGRKVFAANSPFNGTGLNDITLPVPSLAHGVYYVTVDNAARSATKALSVK